MEKVLNELTKEIEKAEEQMDYMSRHAIWGDERIETKGWLEELRTLHGRSEAITALREEAATMRGWLQGQLRKTTYEPERIFLQEKMDILSAKESKVIEEFVEDVRDQLRLPFTDGSDLPF